jgi:hypothetical protein
MKMAESTMLFVIPDATEVVWNIINTVHTQDFQSDKLTKKGQPVKPVKKVKNLEKMYGKYIYILHYLIKEARQNTRQYNRCGVGISSRLMKQRIGVRSPMLTLMLCQLQEKELIIPTQPHSFDKTSKKGIAAKYKLHPSFGELTGTAVKQEFTFEKYGTMIRTIIKNNQTCKQLEQSLKEIDEMYNYKTEKEEKLKNTNQEKPVVIIKQEQANVLFNRILDKIQPSTPKRQIKKLMVNTIINQKWEPSKHRQLIDLLDNFMERIQERIEEVALVYPQPEQVVNEAVNLPSDEELKQALIGISNKSKDVKRFVYALIREMITNNVVDVPGYIEMKAKEFVATIENKYNKLGFNKLGFKVEVAVATFDVIKYMEENYKVAA